ncbi:MAG: anaerobic glycerol-3-phosphate dehydrogenase subunit C [Candidatus Lernaella stagnicola]|nr:anaerobic glycerol-3-phosphate dehydrogenase subunit C [Candidatus Lernaella stagnicola]
MTRRKLIEPLRPDDLYDACIKCTVCVTACPVAQATDAFPGPKQAGPDAQRFRGRGEAVEGDWINLCTGCHRCQVACPADIPIAEINIFAKQRYAAARGRDLPTHLLTNAFRFMPLGSHLAFLINPFLKMRWSRWLAEKLFGISRHAPMPLFARRRFATEARRYQGHPAKRKVAYFYGCFTDSNDPGVGRAVLRVLEAAGVEVVIPEQTCCGAALIGGGNLAAAKKQNEKNMVSLRRALDEGCEAIVVGSPSCTLALAQETAALLGVEAADVQSKVLDLFTYLKQLDDLGELRLSLKPLPQFAAFHEACHLTALGHGANAPVILSRIPEFEIRTLDAGCCGLAGTFGLKHKTADLAVTIGQEVRERVAQWKPDVVLSECEGCRMQITHLTGVPAKHPAEILAAALETAD